MINIYCYFASDNIVYRETTSMIPMEVVFYLTKCEQMFANAIDRNKCLLYTYHQ